ncbi:hypothetical protein KC19_5G083100 [Ceratodon purpureus]|uniref:Uncharacterized protein n=1 Tax=Ceratodon purpureus TaxID=3225 RepID=A0A8T0I0C7_CERPU|nr:hypothetical protein KC19_5G083100 [Ceratodon purpureus]
MVENGTSCKDDVVTRRSSTNLHKGLHGCMNAGLENQPAPNFTTYSNPAFEPVVTVESPPKVQKQPPCIPVDSNGQRLCPTPKSTRSSSSPAASKLRIPKATSFQPLQTIPSPEVTKDQTKRVLGDSNGQWTQETPKVSKQCTTPRGRSVAFGTSCSENMTPRALFNNSQNEAPAAEVRVAVGSNIKKRTRGEDDATRATRSKTEAEKIATFLRSPAARVRPDGTKEEYRLGVSDVLVKQYIEKKIALKKGCQCDPMKSCLGCDGSLNGESYQNPGSVKRPGVKQLSTLPGSPSVRLRDQSPGLVRTSLLRSPFVTSSKKQSEQMTPTSRCGKPTPQGSAKKNLSVLLEAQK